MYLNDSINHDKIIVRAKVGLENPCDRSVYIATETTSAE